MKALVACTLALAAGCDSGTEMFPVGPGGGGGQGGTEYVDAAVDATGDASTMITSRVCVIADPLGFGCAASGAGGLTVTLGDQMATTADNGSFTIARSASATTWRVSGQGIEPSVMKIGAASTIPAFEVNAYDDMRTNNQLGGEAAIIARVTRLGSGLAGVVVTASPVADVYYDGVDANAWETDATGSAGAVWIPDMPSGSAQLTFRLGAESTSVSGVTVVTGAITYVFAEIP